LLTLKTITQTYERHKTQDNHVYVDIIIDPNCSLSISSGTRIEFISWYSIDLDIYSPYYLDTIWNKRILKVRGSLYAIGSENNKIIFTKNDNSIGWHGIVYDGLEQVSNSQNSFYISNNPASILNYCIIEHVNKSTPYGNPNTCGSGHAWDGAIYLANFNNITIENCEFRNNRIFMRGGGLFSIASYYPTTPLTSPTSLIDQYPIINNNKFHNNIAKRGGAICIMEQFSDNVTISNNIVYENIALYSGGGIAIFKDASANILGNTIKNNTAYCKKYSSVPKLTGGGGIVVGNNVIANIENNIILENIACFNPNANIDESGLGGGVLIRIFSNVILTRNTIASNTSAKGGGIALLGDKLLNGVNGSFLNSSLNTISFNNSTYFGGGVYIGPDNDLLFNRNTVHNNNANIGGGIYLNNYNDNNLHNYSFFFNSIFENTADIGGGFAVSSFFDIKSNYYSNIEIVNNLIFLNQSINFAAGFYSDTKVNLNFNNNTICKNSTLNSSNGDGIYIQSNGLISSVSFFNNIIYFNGLFQSECQIYYPDNKPNEFTSNNIMNLGCQIPINNNFNFNPEFVDLGNNDFALCSYSQLN
jgi:hypothetical protein